MLCAIVCVPYTLMDLSIYDEALTHHNVHHTNNKSQAK